MTLPISTVCQASMDGWACRVTVGDDPAATTHEVAVSRGVLGRLRPDDSTPDALVADSFAFLLAREARESILRSFDLTEIRRYFPEWEREICAG
jgi:hypothetical protein